MDVVKDSLISKSPEVEVVQPQDDVIKSKNLGIGEILQWKVEWSHKIYYKGLAAIGKHKTKIPLS